MTRFIRPTVAVACALVALAGCAAAPGAQADLQTMADKVVAAPSRVTALAIAIKQAAYSIKYVRQLDWDVAEALLTNADGSIPVQNQSVPVTVDAQNGRKALVSFTPVKPAAAYTLAITLKRKNAAGVLETVASGTNAGFAINPGANVVNVTLTAVNSGSGSGNGELLVDVSSPVLVLNTLTSNVATQSSFNLQRVAGTAAGGNTLTSDPITTAFREISGLEVDATGTMVVADAGNHQIRLVPPAPAAATILAGRADGTSGFAGDGALATASSLNSPRGVTRDAATGNVFFCDAGNDRIRCIASDGKIYTIAGGGTNTGATVPYAVNASLNQPFGLAADKNGNVYASERGSGRVIKIDTTGALTVLATLTPGAVGPIALDRTGAGGVLWVADGGTVRAIKNLTTTPVLQAGAVFTATGGSYVTGLAFDQLGLLYAQASANNGATAGATQTRIWRVPVDATGLALAGRSAEAIAGTGGTGAAAADYSAPTTAVANATSQLMAGLNWCSLFIDMSGSNTAALSGQLYTGNSYPGAYGQVLKLTPSGL
jgi:hypothetical protein